MHYHSALLLHSGVRIDLCCELVKWCVFTEWCTRQSTCVYRMHYRLYYALYLYENDSSLTASDLGCAFQSTSGQQSIRKYRYHNVY